jgi:hypothetical protein
MAIHRLKFPKSTFFLVCLGLSLLMVACATPGSGGSGSSSTPSVAWTTPPPSSVFSGSNVPIAVSITGDRSNQGVEWSCSPTPNCGTFNSNNGPVETVYVAPVVTSPETVTITAASISDSSVSVNASVTINAPLLADGNYVFSLAGTDKSTTSISTHSPYYVVGAFTIANGAISTGEQDSVDNAAFQTLDQINPTGSSIAQNPDGSLLITLALICPGSAGCSVGVNGVETFVASFLPQNPSKAFITEFDASAAASGTLELQDSTAAAASPLNGYAFAVNGIDSSGYPASIGGVIDVVSPGRISQPQYSVFDINDDAGGTDTVSTAQTFSQTSSSVSINPDGFGRVEFELVPTSSSLLQFNLVGYIVDAAHMQLVETHDTFQGTLGGMALSQGTSTGTFNSASISGDSYVLGLNGVHFDFQTVAPLQVVGLFTFNSDSSVSGFVSADENSQSPTAIVAGTAPNYAVDPTGRVALSGLTVFSNAIPLNPALYLDGSGHALAITLDSGNPGDALEGHGFQQTGGGSFSASSFNGKYGINATGWDVNLKGEFDAVGAISTTGSSGAFSGTADLDWLFSTTPTYSGLAVSGGGLSAISGVPASDGIFTGTITGLDVTTPTNSDQFDFYLIDPAGDAIAVETDANQITLIYLYQQ